VSRQAPRGDVLLPDVGPIGDWADQAACRDADLATFFPPVGDRRTYLAAVAICADCPVRRACLDYAIENRIGFGVWGGLNVDRRRRLAGHTRRRRPPPMPAHGASRYRRGCRCAECRDAHRAESVRYRDAARERAS
jgi:WhiB family transcriptional regulator, redox-sensing transcriptional regulator